MMGSRIFSRLGWTGNRPSVVIFGASGGGRSLFERIRETHEVIGFVDNNPSKHGSYYQNKPIYPAEKIRELSYDRIMVASCYYMDITRQLTSDIGVPSSKITVFHEDGLAPPRTSSRVRQFFDRCCFHLILSLAPPLLARLGFKVLQRLDSTFRSHELTPIHWLDERTEYTESILQRGGRVDVQGQNLLGRSRGRAAITLPDIRLSRYRGATINCTTNSLQCGEELLMWRAPTSRNRHSDYSSGNVLRHGRNFALTESFKTSDVDRGIAIIGSVDVNYYHWMLEVVSKLEYLDRLGHAYVEYPILISAKAREIEAISSFVDQLDVKRQVIFLQSYQYYRVGDLLTITPPNFMVANLAPDFWSETRHQVSDSYCTPSSLQFLRRTALAHLANKDIHAVAHERVFFARKGVFRAYNQDEVQALLESAGFKAVHLEDLSFAEQVFTMQRAKYVVGPTGAAWTNLLFCEPGTKALCWTAEEYGDCSCFSQIADEMGVDMDYLLYTTGYANSRELFYGSYRVDVEPIKSWLVENQLGGGAAVSPQSVKSKDRRFVA